jgi:hypothetical protein
MALKCGECDGPVHMNAEGHYERECTHLDAKIVANLSATVYGESAVANGNKKAISLLTPEQLAKHER